MEDIKTKLADWRERLRDRHMFTIVMIIVVLLFAVIALGLYTYQKQREFRQASENSYNRAFYELINYIEEVETYLAKATITSTAEHEAETLANVWSEANLAAVFLSQLPINTEELENSQKFLNQVSNYSYTLSQKAMAGEDLTDEELKNLESLHEYAVGLKDTLNQLANEINEGTISWGELTREGTITFAQQVDNISKDSFGNIETTFHDYAGLIYDGAFSDHMTNPERKGLIGENIDETLAKQIAKEFTGADENSISSNGLIENGNIPSYNFIIKQNEVTKTISISQKGGHIVYMNCYREITEEKITDEEAIEIGKNFLNEKGYKSMQETYYLKQDGNIVINYAYSQDDVKIYPDLIKVKIALDNGEILGIETLGYLNCHTERQITKNIISEEQAKEKLNPRIEIMSQNLAIIPTEYNTEILCWEFTGKARRKRIFSIYKCRKRKRRRYINDNKYTKRNTYNLNFTCQIASWLSLGTEIFDNLKNFKKFLVLNFRKCK